MTEPRNKNNIENIYETLDDHESQMVDSQNKLNDTYVYVRSFYTNDWATAINNAISYAYTNSKGRVIMPNGTLSITTPIIMKSGVSLEGMGRNVTILQPTSDLADYVVKVTGGGQTSLSQNKFKLKDFKISGNGSVNCLGGIKIDWAYIYQIENVDVGGIYNDSAYGLYLSNSFNAYIKSSRFALGYDDGTIHKYGTGVYVTSSSPGENVTQVKFDDCLMQYNATGFSVNLETGGSEISLENSGIGKNTTGISLDGYTTQVRIALNHIEYSDTGIDIKGNTRFEEIDSNDFFDVKVGIKINANDSTKIKQNIFNGVLAEGESKTTYYALQTTGTCTRIDWDNNSVYTAYYQGSFNTGTNLINVIDKSTVSYSNNSTSISISPSCTDVFFNNTVNTSFGDLPAGIEGQVVTFHFRDDYTRFYVGGRIVATRGIGLTDTSITMRYNATADKWFEIGRCEKRSSSAPPTTNIGGGMVAWNSGVVAGGTMGWVAVSGAWKTFGTVQA